MRPLVATGFEIDVERRTARFFPCSLKGNDFRMAHAVVGVKPLADDSSAADQNGADHGVRAGEGFAAASQGQGAGHPAFVVVRRHGDSIEQGIDERLGVERHQIVGRFAGAHEAHGQVELAHDGNHDAAAGGAVELAGRTMPVTPAEAVNSRAGTEAVLAGVVASSTRRMKKSCGAPGNEFGGGALHFFMLGHEV